MWECNMVMRRRDWLIAWARLWKWQQVHIHIYVYICVCVCQSKRIFFSFPGKKRWCLLLNATLGITWTPPGWCAAVASCLICFLTSIYLEIKGETAWKWWSCECVMNVLSVWNKKRKGGEKKVQLVAIYRPLIGIDRRAYSVGRRSVGGEFVGCGCC